MRFNQEKQQQSRFYSNILMPRFEDELRTRRRRKYLFRIGAAIFGIVVFGGFWIIAGMSYNELTVEGEASLLKKIFSSLPFTEVEKEDPDYIMPSAEEQRYDILLMGMRGEDDPDGGLLTDTVMLLSYDRISERSALISIPRDLYVKVKKDRKEKINSAYEILGLGGTKELFSKITGVYVDAAIIFDFEAFKTLVDSVDGIDITLLEPFTEETQWGHEFSLPAGENHLNGDDALYYVRSRYSTSDFDRANRQQKVIIALKKKVLSRDILTSPSKALLLLNTLRENLETDINIRDIPGLISLASDLSGSTDTIRRYVLSPLNLLEEGRQDELYVLLPYGGDFTAVKTFFKDVLNETPPNIFRSVSNEEK